MARVQHSSSTKWNVFNTVAVQNGSCCGHTTKQRVVNDLLTAESASLMEIHKRIRHIYVEDATDVSSDTAPIVFTAVKRTLVTGPPAVDQLWQ